MFEDANVFGELWWGKRLVGVKVDLAAAEPARVEELLTEAWLRRAPKPPQNGWTVAIPSLGLYGADRVRSHR